MQSFRATLLVVLAALLLVPAVGSAATGSSAPPGNSGIDQYRESAPPSSPGSRKLTPEQRRGLSEQGADGKALAAALEQSGGVPAAAEPAAKQERSDGSKADVDDGEERRTSSARRGEPSDAARTDRADTQSRTNEASADRPVQAATSSVLATKLGPVPIWVLLVFVAAGCLGVVGLRRGQRG